ncbi:MAG: extracellular solute-binding protein, partial [Pseudomonadota bacterium]
MANEVNIYSYRQEFLLKPFLDEFNARTGIKANVVYAKSGLLERLESEGANSPADLVLTVDISRLQAIADAGLFQAVQSSTLENNIPENLRSDDNVWFGLSKRARVIAVSNDRIQDGEIKTLEELADGKWEGRLCARPGSHVYNRALIASVVAAHGEETAQKWAEGIVANFARKPQGNDRAQIRAVAAGVCDVAIVNNYYYGVMQASDEAEQNVAAAKVHLVYLNQDGRGNHVNISGGGVV